MALPGWGWGSVVWHVLSPEVGRERTEGDEGRGSLQWVLLFSPFLLLGPSLGLGAAHILGRASLLS
jgi:hypothetical protein